MNPSARMTLVAVALVGLAHGVALAETRGDPPRDASATPSEDSPASDSPLEFHGFVSQGAFISTANNYLGYSKRGSPEFFEAGLNVSKEVTDRLRFGIQLFAHDLGPVGNYNARVDWAYLDYRWREWLGFRAGRIKLPYGLYNEFADIDAARVSVLLPPSVYPVENRDYLLAETGAGLYGSTPWGWLGALDYQLTMGTIYIGLNDASRSAAVQDIDTKYAGAAQVFWRTPLTGLRFGASAVTLNLAVDSTLTPAQLAGLKASGMVSPNYDGSVRYALRNISLYVGSLEYVFGDWLFAAEYSQWRGKFKVIPAVAVIPEQDSERLYGMINRRFTSWFEASAYYSLFFADRNDRDGTKPEDATRFTPTHRAFQHDVALSMRFDINEYWLFKLEGHFMDGTASLTAADNPNPSKLKQRWGMFLAKTTLSF